MDASRRDDLNDFIQELSLEIPEIVIATPAVDWNDAYDYQTLSNYADLFIMGYDYHWLIRPIPLIHCLVVHRGDSLHWTGLSMIIYRWVSIQIASS